MVSLLFWTTIAIYSNVFTVYAKVKKHYLVTNHNLELQNELPESLHFAWTTSLPSCIELCSDKVGKWTDDSVTKYGMYTGKCECFRLETINNFTMAPRTNEFAYSYDRT